jgi:peptidoglycan-associated lipoprotein
MRPLRPFAKTLAKLGIFLAVSPFLVASKCGDKKDTGTGGGSEGTDTIPPIESTLQVISIDPDRIAPMTSFRGQIFGSGFAEGVEVTVGTTLLASVTRYDQNTLAVTVPPLEMGAYDVKVRNPNGDSHVLRAGLLVRADAAENQAGNPNGSAAGFSGVDCNTTLTLPFDFDAAMLTPSATQSLQKHLTCFTNGTASVRIEGHCDERGTTEYNLALGQRRANTVKSWLQGQGVPPSRIRTVTFGEERPLDMGHDESSWARNRRAEVSISR